jgi:hypothetical protein
MKKVFETNDKRESSFLKNHLNDKYYESEIRNTSGKYEIFVIRIGKKNDYASLNYKIINFIIVIISHIVITGFIIKIYIELMY